tara:strand:- start:797 stop:1069 length:273 start_codon:yes stop_codon:yes gene_type:complete
MYDEIADIIREELRYLSFWSDLKERYVASDSVMDEALDEHIDTAVDYVYCDLQPMIEGWLQRHGCQITDLINDDVKRLVEEQEDEEKEYV